MGTAPYSAPESAHIHGLPALRGLVGTFTDVYSLGVSLLEILAGVRAPRLTVSSPSPAELQLHQPRLLQALAHPPAEDEASCSQAAPICNSLLEAIKNMLHVDVRRRSSLAEVANCARQSVAAAGARANKRARSTSNPADTAQA